jgi:hypothetical protein
MAIAAAHDLLAPERSTEAGAAVVVICGPPFVRSLTQERPALSDVLNVEAGNSPILEPENVSDRFIF